MTAEARFLPGNRIQAVCDVCGWQGPVRDLDARFRLLTQTFAVCDAEEHAALDCEEKDR